MSVIDALLAPVAARTRLGDERLRYLLAGGLNTLVGNLTYPALYLLSPWFHAHDLAALGVAQPFNILFAYTTYKLFVFRTRGRVIPELMRFCPLYVAIAAVNWAVYLPLTRGLHVPKLAVQVPFSILVVVLSYLWNRRVTFRRRPQAS